jgi:hypothetical protein
MKRKIQWLKHWPNKKWFKILSPNWKLLLKPLLHWSLRKFYNCWKDVEIQYPDSQVVLSTRSFSVFKQVI